MRRLRTSLNTMGPLLNDHHLAEDILKYILSHKVCFIVIQFHWNLFPVAPFTNMV